MAKSSGEASKGVDSAQVRHICQWILNAVHLCCILNKKTKNTLQDSSIEWEWLPENAIDPLTSGKSRSCEHSYGWEDVGDDDSGDDCLDWPNLREPIIRCIVILQRRLDIVEEVIYGCNKANASDLVENAEDSQPIRSQYKYF